MTDWDGRGLPPVARQRLARFGQGSARTSLLSAGGAAGVESVGLTPIGEVMGCIVQHIGWRGWGGCGMYAFNTFTPPTVTSGIGSQYAGYRPYVDALYRGYDTAMARLLAEAAGMGADGVVGIRLSVGSVGDAADGNREFVALGTAVRAHSRIRPRTPFTTELAGQDVAKLMHNGWMPAGLAYGIAVAIRHDDYATRMQRSWTAGNVEVSGYTELVNRVRADARAEFEHRATRLPADGCVGTRVRMHVWEIEPGEGHVDHVAEATVFGNAVVTFGRQQATGPVLPVLPLRPSGPQAPARGSRP